MLILSFTLNIKSVVIKITLKQPHRVKGKVKRSRSTESVINKNVTHPFVS